MIDLNTLNAASLLNLYNGAIVDYGAPEGFDVAKRFVNKGAAIEAIEALCAAGSLAVSFDGEAAVIVDASDAQQGGDDEAKGGDDEAKGNEADGGDDEAKGGDEAEAVAFGDGKGKRRAWGFVLGSDAWLEANPRGTPAREAYRAARRKAARMARKLSREAAE